MISRRRDPCASPKWRQRRRRFSRRRASSPRQARSRSPARARNMSEASRLRAIAAAAAAERWSLPAVEGPIVGGRRREVDPAQTALALEKERSRGYEAGLAAARAEI